MKTIVNFTQSIVDDTIQKKTWYFSIKQDLALKLLGERLESVASGAKNWRAVINILPFPMIFTDGIVIAGVPLNIIRKMGDGRTYIPRKWSNINQEDVERRKQIGIESAEERKRKRDERIAKFGNPRRRLS